MLSFNVINQNKVTYYRVLSDFVFLLKLNFITIILYYYNITICQKILVK